MFCSEQGDLSSCRFIFVRSNDLRCSFPVGIKDYSNWPTIPQVYLNGEFVGGCDILLQMHQNGDLVEELKKLGIRSALLDETKDQDSKWGKVAPGEGPLVSACHHQRSLTRSGSQSSDDCLRWFLQFVSSQVILACLVFRQGISYHKHNRNHCTVIINVVLQACCKQNSFLCCTLLFAKDSGVNLGAFEPLLLFTSPPQIYQSAKII